jgi:hypothetical protein
MNTSGGLGTPGCSITSDNDKESDPSITNSQGSGITPYQRKCICMVVCVMFFTFFLALLVGVSFGIFNS